MVEHTAFKSTNLSSHQKFVRDLESNHDKWEKFGEKGDKWRVRDATEQEKYEFLKPLVNEQHF